jgi:glycine/D-amino acid oxidase-like deaminating enzyme
MTVDPRASAPYWLEEAPLDPPAEPLRGETDADVAIVGGGYTGLWTALTLLRREPTLRVVLLEAERVGHGPSGRNGGFLYGFWSRLPRLRERLGDAGALEVLRAGDGVIDAVRTLGDDVWLREGGYLKVSAAPAQDASVDRLLEAAGALGLEDEVLSLSPDEVAERCRSPRFRRGALIRNAGTVQPARLVRELRRAALDAGLELHERSPVRRVGRGRVETDGGAVRVPHVVVAINSWAAGWRPVRQRVTNFGSYCVATEPVPDLLEQIGWTDGEAITDGRMFLHYFRTTRDGRVVMGSGAGPIGRGGRVDGRLTVDRGSVGRAEAGLRFLLPDLAEARVTHAWGGPIDVSSDQLPFFGTHRPGLHYGLGYSGSGVGASWLGGQILASLALGADDEWSRLPLVDRELPRLPPEPLKSLGGRAIRAATLAVEDAEQAGRRASAPAQAVAEVPRLLGRR